MTGTIYAGASTPKETRARIQVICAAYAVAHPTLLKTVAFDNAAALTAAGSPASGVVVTDCPFDNASMPALVEITTVGTVQAEGGGTGQIHITRNYLLLVLFYQMCDASVGEQVAALDAAWAKIDELPDYFRSTAVSNHTGLKGSAFDYMTDGGVEISTWNGGTYSSVIYTLPVTATRR